MAKAESVTDLVWTPGCAVLGQRGVMFSRELAVIQSFFVTVPGQSVQGLEGAPKTVRAQGFVLEIVQEVEKQQHYRLGRLKTCWLL